MFLRIPESHGFGEYEECSKVVMVVGCYCSNYDSKNTKAKRSSSAPFKEHYYFFPSLSAKFLYTNGFYGLCSGRWKCDAGRTMKFCN